ncbi:hypothetical protein EW026_g2866 [Hermanssonia centrifuga]|uniref:Pre-mRNA-splicing factor SYF2 n=1 Tax=Hermanssonia centrifuga TaxID=98765 RepID=A0A4S4KMW2_9APHY|nr:hypothetical protein EW026_g2866 [Hermanssonia centrifuga]
MSKVIEAAEEFVETMTDTQSAETEVECGQNGEGSNGSESSMAMEERKARMEKLRQKMRSSALANRAQVVEESAKAKFTVREAARMDRQRKLAEVLRQKADAEERGDDVERQKNWEYTIEENDEWEKKLARKGRRADFEFHNDADASRKRYKKDLDLLKPDIAAYNKQKEIALGLAPGTLSKPGSSSSLSITNFDPLASSSIIPTSVQQRLAAENLYRDANSLLYADNKPTEEAIDRVISKMNKDIDKKKKFSRKRNNEDDGDITYINERNRVFNKKIARYYDKYTAEIRASFERGTAL